MNPTPPTDLSRLLGEVERLDALATSGPWLATTLRHPNRRTFISAGPDELFATDPRGYEQMGTPADARFIAFARTALPKLAAIVAQLQREREEFGSKFESQRSNAEGLFEKVNALKSEIGPLKTDRHALMICLEHSREKETNLINELTTLRAQLSAAQQRVEELEAAHEALADEATDPKQFLS